MFGGHAVVQEHGSHARRLTNGRDKMAIAAQVAHDEGTAVNIEERADVVRLPGIALGAVALTQTNRSHRQSRRCACADDGIQREQLPQDFGTAHGGQ